MVHGPTRTSLRGFRFGRGIIEAAIGCLRLGRSLFSSSDRLGFGLGWDGSSVVSYEHVDIFEDDVGLTPNGPSDARGVAAEPRKSGTGSEASDVSNWSDLRALDRYPTAHVLDASRVFTRLRLDRLIVGSESASQTIAPDVSSGHSFPSRVRLHHFYLCYPLSLCETELHIAECSLPQP